MSYDVYLTVNGRDVYDRNHTRNTSSMWREAGCDVADFDGRPAVLLGYAARCAVYRLRTDPDRYVRWEPANGWGSRLSTIAFLEDLATACQAFPDAIVEVSW